MILGFAIAFISYYILCALIWGYRWSLFVSKDKRPPILNTRHTDFTFWFLRWIPRWWVTFITEKEPIKLIGTAPIGSHLDITPKGTWAITFPLFFTVRTKSGFHFRIGDRYDYIDRYYEFLAIAIKRIN